MSRDALGVTIGTDDRSYVKGLRGASGNATVLYDHNDGDGAALMNSIFDNTASDDLEFVFNNSNGGSFGAQQS